MYPEPPPGQGPVDPRGAFSAPTPPGAPGSVPGNPSPAPSGAPPQFGNVHPSMGGGMPPMPPMPPMYPPPGFMPPPMFMPPPPPPRQRGSFARSIFTVLATTILGLSLTLNVYLMLASGLMSGGSNLRESDIVHGDPTQKVAVIPIAGLIDDEMCVRFDRFMRTAEQDKNVKAIVLQVDSPGGTVTAADEIYHRIQQFKAAKQAANQTIPVVVSQSGLAASGGYYVSCGGDYIFAQPTTLTGNIGVIMPRFNLSKLMDKWGIEETTITSKGATFKNAGSMFKASDPEAEAYIQDLADKAFDKFKEIVKAGRPILTTKELNDLANGKIYTAKDALKLKLIDEIGYAEDACNYAATKAGLSKKTIVRYQNPPSFLDMFGSQSNLPARGTSNITINGVNVDAKGINELTTPRLMYLWRGE